MTPTANKTFKLSAFTADAGRSGQLYISADDLEHLFDALSDVVFFIKDREGRYTHANITLVHRLGMKDRRDVIGRHVRELFPVELSDSYSSQDVLVLNGEIMNDQLELHLFPNRTHGWCLTFKRPLIQHGTVSGLMGISHDLGHPDRHHPTYNRLQRMLSHMRSHYAQALRIDALAQQAALSVAQLERHCLHVFKLTPRQLLAKVRIEAAMHLLRDRDSIAEVGLACGYTDQSAFTRQFKSLVGLTPGHYRAFSIREKGVNA